MADKGKFFYISLKTQDNLHNILTFYGNTDIIIMQTHKNRESIIIKTEGELL